jgi:hypothetical protein
MPIAAALVVSEPQRAVFNEVFRKANTDQFALGLPPHMSFAVFDEADIARLERIMERFVDGTRPLELCISSIAMFPVEQPVVYALPTVTSALLDAQRRFHCELGNLTDKCWDYYKPDLWSPHLALGGADSLESALQIISVAYDARLRGSYLFDEMALVEFPSVKIISVHKWRCNDRA